VEEVMSEVLEGWDHNDVMCSYKLNHAIGAYLAKTAKDQRGILKSAFEQGVPVFVPAFTDSELGLDVCAQQSAARVDGGGTRSGSIHFLTSSILRLLCCGRSAWEFSPSGAAFRGTGLSSSDRSSSLRHRRLGENVP